ncbi:MAG: 50S ribosomal protein L14e [Candidatus Bathyarchaeota archaeon]
METSALDIGRICVKKLGRETGKKCVIVDVIDKSFVLVTGPKALTGVKRRRVNIRHLEPTNDSMKIARKASDEDILALVQPERKTEEPKTKAKPKTRKKAELKA